MHCMAFKLTMTGCSTTPSSHFLGFRAHKVTLMTVPSHLFDGLAVVLEVEKDGMILALVTNMAKPIGIGTARSSLCLQMQKLFGRNILSGATLISRVPSVMDSIRRIFMSEHTVKALSPSPVPSLRAGNGRQWIFEYNVFNAGINCGAALSAAAARDDRALPGNATLQGGVHASTTPEPGSTVHM